ncbi:aminotransferase class I/II-fold pyridoxal phosphate-dependent enzyme [Desulfitibacter alkalitolerans]|uniref:aminotransferase class I/II-fold pyridoxal phosphate-dependent enzyme n=1 Tax=Desulfitibacter alkalitolerans TaxID=264641 RepID=UPI0004830A08|nr:aminotransferase class I/II-fold pyridoxal phosphate-dependent enzyme [Desulfitibacter alkalitolerans]
MLNHQSKTPVFDAVKKYMTDNTIPFHVPGHKQGRGIPEFCEFVGKNTLGIDLTCLPDTDNICNPTGVIAEAEELAAKAFGADKAYFLVNGTTNGIQAMIMSVCKPGDKIILPRNAHKSAFGGLIISGAIPIYVRPEMDLEYGISTGVSVETLKAALDQHPDAKGIFIINPNYYGTASKLEEIVELAHSYGVPVLVDEAHGAHLHLSDELPLSAMQAGADIAASSTHKLLGSMTQSSMLLIKSKLISPQRVKAVLNITQTTSPSYVLMSSLDVARKQIALRGDELIRKTLELARWARQEMCKIPGIKLFEPEEETCGCKKYDITKLTINVKSLGLSGYDMERILRRDYRIQVELADLYNVIFLLTLADDEYTIKYLINSCREIAEGRQLEKILKYVPPWPAIPTVSVSPRDAMYSETKRVPLIEAVGEVSAEMIMAYPPGIPLVCPGEYISKETIDYVQVLKNEQADLQGTEDPKINYIKVLKPALSLARVGDQIS